MFEGVKKLLKQYDDWCESMGLTPENKRSCVPYRTEESKPKEESREES